jgi:hypothetical protein
VCSVSPNASTLLQGLVSYKSLSLQHLLCLPMLAHSFKVWCCMGVCLCNILGSIARFLWHTVKCTGYRVPYGTAPGIRRLCSTLPYTLNVRDAAWQKGTIGVGSCLSHTNRWGMPCLLAGTFGCARRSAGRLFCSQVHILIGGQVAAMSHQFLAPLSKFMG